MYDILIIAPFGEIPAESANCRYFYLSRMLAARKDVNCELVISSFSHLKKAPRDTTWQPEESFKLTYIEEPGYPKNVCLQRFKSHRIMGKNLSAYLEGRKQPDVIFCAVPSLDAAQSAATYCEKHHVRFIIDVQDLWPEAFEMVIHLPPFSTLAFLPLKKQADYIYSRADDIVAVSQTYVNRAARVNRKAGAREAVFLGTKLSDFDRFRYNGSHDSTVCRIAYVGTLGHSYNITSILQALDILKQQGHHEFAFDVMGDGPLFEEFRKQAESRALPVHFYGRLPYPEMVCQLTQCDIAVNPIAKGAAQSIINKVGDYAAAGLPVISTQECPEYRDLVYSRQLGFNCNNNDPADIAKKLLLLQQDSALRRQMGKNNRRLAEERFDRAQSYPVIVDLMIK